MIRAIKILLAIVILWGEMLYISPNGKRYYINEFPDGPRYVHPMGGDNAWRGNHEPDMLIDKAPGYERAYPVGVGRGRNIGPDYPLFEPSEDDEDDY